ncbi:hypothetical protein [uncultured Sphingomonas sp.]|uniref:hypothetical protein n=1 Tax=uncultured Sphingomonas sp. TaxID=158754 RepID=UPI0025F4CC56|nr:hypothetical protein [uncultured Sphingomonas sp.]
MTTRIAEYPGGAVEQWVESEHAPARPTPLRIAETPRLGLPAETWDWDAGEWVVQIEPRRAEALTAVEYERHQAYEALPVSPLDREYDAKAAEAQRVAGPWPYLEAEAEARGVSIDAVRDTVLARAAESAAPRARIAGLAVAAKAAIRDAGTVTDIDQAVACFLAALKGE